MWKHACVACVGLFFFYFFIFLMLEILVLVSCCFFPQHVLVVSPLIGGVQVLDHEHTPGKKEGMVGAWLQDSQWLQ